ncbi:glucose 1-dehydrogenase [Martelella sp. AD-3]|uniref:SDR family NAD(P)-dependent oxidoreductase n=1 Tax=Martelella sp. AD-3 TaxID=686597 RepID=UPI0004634657|nr:glucose 1-dehydrogenase [Martelella sp. AD-3]AMM85538.1 oxidoreductase [Martelella sp. AD-3]MAM13794.1 3-oxoacyl-ACP reductase [Rhizobiaceae bacterium]|tara:strand:+ start:227 stop:991 length:765 start_codon:yes stop_codon:yes gene_type:complete
MAQLKDKVAIITGGAGGIGIATAKRMTVEGAKVLLVDLDEDALKDAVAELGHDKAAYAVADVTDPEQTQAYVAAAVEKFGKLDILVANAGIEGVVKPITDYPTEMFDKVMAVNVRGIFLGLKYAMPELKKTKGNVVIMASVAGLGGTPDVSAYITSKHALVGLMRTAALEGARDGIRVNSIHPSPVETRMMRSLEEGFAPGHGGEAKKGFAASIPLQRYAEPDEIADAVVYLASDQAKFVTGVRLPVDGGMTAD